MKSVIKLMPTNIYNIYELQKWLDEKSAQGLRLKSCNGIFGEFEKSENAGDVFYKVLPVDKKDKFELTDEVKTKADEKGFTYICTMKNLYHIFTSTNADIDFSIAEENYNFIKGKLNQSISFDFIIIALVLMFFGTNYFKGGMLVYKLLTFKGFFFLTVGLVLLIAIIMALIGDIKSMKNLKNQIKGENNNSSEKIKTGISTVKAVIAVILAAIVIVLPSVHYSLSWSKNFEDIEKTLPYVLLNMVEQNEYYSRYNPVSIGDGIVRKTNSATRSWSPLAPLYYNINQTGKIPDLKFNHTNDPYTPESNIEYFRVSSKIFIKPLLNELLKKYVDLPMYMTTDAANGENGFETAFIIKVGNTEHFFGAYDNNVIYLSYHGNNSIEPFVTNIYESIEYIEY